MMYNAKESSLSISNEPWHETGSDGYQKAVLVLETHLRELMPFLS